MTMSKAKKAKALSKKSIPSSNDKENRGVVVQKVKAQDGGSSIPITPPKLDPKYAVLAALGLVPITPLLLNFEVIPKVETNNNNGINAGGATNQPDDPCKDSTLHCDECDLYFKTKNCLKVHYIKEHQSRLRYYCKICSKLFSSRRTMHKHREEIHNGQKPYSCNLCPLNFVCLEALTAHVRRHNGKLPYTCKVCQKGFQLYQELKEHIPIHELKKIVPLPTTSKKIHECKICDRQFRKPCDLERHIRVHTGEKPYSCSVCGNRFQQAHNLTKHMIIHTKEKQFECDLCKKVFGRSDVLTRHMITHSVQKPHPCEFCPQSFARAAQLIDHMGKKHVDAEGVDFVAPIKKTKKPNKETTQIVKEEMLP